MVVRTGEGNRMRTFLIAVLGSWVKLLSVVILALDRIGMTSGVTEVVWRLIGGRAAVRAILALGYRP